MIGYSKAINQRIRWESSQKMIHSKINKGTYASKKNRNADKNKTRVKRSVSIESNVEILVVADKEMIEFYANDDLTTYILTVMNMVRQVV